jgi:hypothetical protein
MLSFSFKIAPLFQFQPQQQRSTYDLYFEANLDFWAIALEFRESWCNINLSNVPKSLEI